jgi:hypothetical protein
MFGHQDNQPTEQSDQAAKIDSKPTEAPAPVADQLHIDPEGATTGSTPVDPSTQTSDDQSWQHPGEVLDDVKADTKNQVSPAGGYPKPLSSKEPVLTPVPAISAHAHPSISPDSDADGNQLTEATNDTLIHVKQEALDELFPLIDKLDQTPDEHFKTLMMIIQASDNHTLIEKAFQIAQTIDDEKIRAQALLDIINEINYFTQQPKV